MDRLVHRLEEVAGLWVSPMCVVVFLLGFRQRTGSFGLWFFDAADWVARRDDHHCFGVGGSKLAADWVARRNDRSRG